LSDLNKILQVVGIPDVITYANFGEWLPLKLRMPKVTAIDQTAAEILQFFDFSNLAAVMHVMHAF